MTINLQKGQKISLEKAAPGLKAAFVGLGWDVRQTAGQDFDLDTSVFLLNANDKLPNEQYFLFYNNLNSPDPDQSVKLMGDNRTGAGEGDDEGIILDLRKIPQDVQKVVFTVTIYDAENRKHNFGQVENAFVRLLNVETKEEVLRYDLDEDYSIETAMIMAELYRQESDWRMSAIGQGYQGGLQALVNRYQ
ncbi:TerD family protein [Spirulina sp. CS-785/01]|uniref:TerD family protein n=1 Tax=Spirulina sp. CS-785/01 TaxID=3021716 RepID=UPI00232D0D38|nr:TerD family protein [Spirulina sp. CS-785/01]MDB9313879.1 TerD family protein [Spirulina sp. CS-785/01]